MTKRLQIILDNILPCKVFADIGCDHGYITKGVLDSKKCERAYFSDISKECLKKAKTLLEEYESGGEAKGVQGNGFENIDYCDFALIAGMGGEEIISILENSLFLPNKLLLQPMKNVDKLRVYLVEKGYKILKDFCFEDGKFYDLILCEQGKDSLTEEEIIFGRSNLVLPYSKDFLKRLTLEKQTLNTLLEKELPKSRKEEILTRLRMMEKYV